MFLNNVSTCALALCLTQIMSAYATYRIANISSEIALNPLVCIQDEFATLSLRTIRNNLPSPPALQADYLDGYWIFELFPDSTCTNFYYRLSRVLNTCVDISGDKDSTKTYRIIRATTTYVDITLYSDPTCTTLKIYDDDDDSGGDSGEKSVIKLTGDTCNVGEHLSGKSYYSALGDVATTRPISKRM